MIVDNCNPSTWETKERGPRIQGHPQLHNQSEVNKDYRGPCPKNKQRGDGGACL